jgi:hypothetical protein
MRALSLLALTMIFGSAAAWSFSGDNHKAISKQALSDLKYDEAAADEVIAGNLQTDKDEFWDTEAHFDDENLKAGSKRLKNKLLAALQALDDCQPDKAREQLGRAIHPVQDFFAHSNWVENHPDAEAVDLLNLRDPGADVVCDPKTHKGPLTTGYYYDDSKHPDKPTPAPRGKCLHADLHKDDDSRPMFAEARARALTETKAILNLFDAAVIRKYSRVSAYEWRFRLRLLKDSSDGFADERNRCVPNQGSSVSRTKDLLKIDSPFWH